MKNIPTQSRPISDAIHGNWVDRFCPSWSKPFLKLSRLDRPIGTWLLLLPCWWGSSLALCFQDKWPSMIDYWILISCIIGAILMRGAGCTWNDINDQNFDSKVARTKLRPIPSGQISTKKAMAWLLIQVTLSFIILLTFNKFAIILGMISILPVAIYPFAKRFTWWPQFFLGICFNWGVLISFAAHNNSIETNVVILYVAGIFWTIFYDTIYAFQDAEDDALIGLKSTALLFGDSAKYWLAFFILMIYILINVAFSQTPTSSLITEIIMRCGATAFCIHLIWQLLKFEQTNSDICLKLFQSNKSAGLILVFFSVLAFITGQI